MKAAEKLLGLFAGILVSDRHGAYGTHPSDQRQLCWAHIIRNLERIAGYRGDAGELGRWLVHFARIIIQLHDAIDVYCREKDQPKVERIMTEEGLSPREATHKAMGQIFGAIIAITLVLCAVFVPMTFFEIGRAHV